MTKKDEKDTENITSDDKITSLILSKIKQVRKEKKISQKQIAEVLGISQVAYSKIEKGEVELGIERFFQLLAYLEIENPFEQKSLTKNDTPNDAYKLIVQQNQHIKDYFELELAHLNEKKRFIEKLLGNSQE